MKLKGSKYFEINLCVLRAKEMKRENSTVNIYLEMNPKENLDKVKEDLEKGYGVKVLGYWKNIDTLNSTVPAKNLRKVVEEKCIKDYELPGVIELLSSPSHQL